MFIKRIISTIISILMITGIIPSKNIADNDTKLYVVSNEYATVEPTKNADDEYLISSVENLQWFSDAVNSGDSEIKARLTADIAFNSGIPTDSSRIWTPIGTQANPFFGSFDGGSYTVNGIFINSASDNQGFFGYLGDNAVVTGLKLTNAVIKGGNNVGAVAGYITGATVEECTVQATVTGTGQNVGGIVGEAYSLCTISLCNVSGNISGKSRVGGVCGFAFSNSVITGAKANVTVTATDTYAGGIVGFDSGSTVSFSYGRTTVSGTNRVGGVAGYATYGIFASVYIISDINSQGTSKGAFLGADYGSDKLSIFYNSELCNFTDNYAVEKTSDEMSRPSFVTIINDGDSEFVFDYLEINNGFPILKRELNTDVWNGMMIKPKTAAGVYQISTPAELAWFCGLVNGTISGETQNQNACGELTSNIVLNYGTDWNEKSNIWTPIGSDSSPFLGTFDGNGHQINGVYINTTKNNQGLFGYIGEGSRIKDVSVTESYVKGNENVGSIVGYCYKGEVYHCENVSNVDATNRNVGGIVGYNNMGNVSYCYNSGNILSTAGNVGGVIGYNRYSSYVMGCRNYGTVTGTSIVGGVIGYNDCNSTTGVLNNSYNMGEVTSNDGNGSIVTDSYVGGVVGIQSQGSVNNCFNAGTVNGYYCGGIAGRCYLGELIYCYNTGKSSGVNVGGIVCIIMEGRIRDTYNAGTVIGTKAVAIACSASNTTIERSYYDSSKGMYDAKATALTTDEMTGSAVFASFVSSRWETTPDENEYCFYPKLHTFTIGEDEKMIGDSLQSVKTLKGKYRVEVIKDNTTNYFENFADATSYIGTGTGTIIVMKDVTVDTTAYIRGKITIKNDGFTRTITRASSFDESFFNVTGTLNLGEGLENLGITINGNADKHCCGDSIFTVNATGTVNVNKDVLIENCYTEDDGAVFNINGGTVNLYSAGILDNYSECNGGAANVFGGTLNAVSCEIAMNTAVSGGFAYNNGGTVLIKSGDIYGNFATEGGLIYNNGRNAVAILSNNGNIFDNSAEEKGGVIYNHLGTVTVNTDIKSNYAGAAGGAIYNDSGNLILAGSTIYGNITNGAGAAIYNDGNLSVRGNAVVSVDNDVYLPDGKTVTFDDVLNSTDTVMKLTVENYSVGSVVLKGEYVPSYFKRIKVFGTDNNEYYLDSAGRIQTVKPVTVALVSRFGLHDAEYTNLNEAIESVGANVANITICNDCTINSPAEITGDITISCFQTDYTVTRGPSMSQKDMFVVKPGGNLSFGDTASLNEDVEAMLTIDGGSQLSRTGGSVVCVEQGGVCSINAGTKIINNKNLDNGGAAVVYGTLNLNGGIISNNQAVKNGGAFYNEGVINLGGIISREEDKTEIVTEVVVGGTISSNTCSSGGAVYNLGMVNATCVNMSGNFGMEGNGIYNGGVVTVKDGVTFSDNIYLVTDKTIDIIGELTAEKVADIELQNFTEGTQILTGDSDYYNLFKLNSNDGIIDNQGKLFVSRLVLGNGSELKVNRTKGIITNIDLNNRSVEYIKSQFSNIESSIKVFDENLNEVENNTDVATGYVLKLMNDETVIDELTVVIYGDVSGDGLIDGNDSAIISMIAGGMLTVNDISAAQRYAADADHSGYVDITDAQFAALAGLYKSTVNQNI